MNGRWHNHPVLRTRVWNGPGWAYDLAEPWLELIPDAPSATPFQTWQWHSTWFRHFGRGKRAYVVAVYEGDDLIGLMPLYRTFGPWRALRPMGCGASDYLHPLARRGLEGQVAAAIAIHFAELKGVDLIDLHQIRESEPLATALMGSIGRNGQQLNQAACPVLDLPDTFDAYLAGLGKSLRYDVRRMEGKFGQERGLRLVPFDAGSAHSGMDQLFHFHRLRWRKRGLPGAFVGKRVQAFHREWSRLAADEGWLRLSSLFAGDEPVGVIYAMALGDSCYFYQSGFDPQFSSLSPGTLLVADAIRKAIAEGKRHFDFMRGDEPYKRRWKPQRMVHNLRFMAPSGALLGRFAQAWNGAGFFVEAKIRARLEGHALP